MKTKNFKAGNAGLWRGAALGLRMIIGMALMAVAAQAANVEYTVTVTQGTGGLIFPSGAVKVGAGSSPVFFIIPNDTYSVQDVRVNGSSVGSMSEVTLGPVSANQTLTASFIKSSSITASAGAGGAISPPGKQVVGYGGSRTFLILATPGYKVKSVLVNGVAVTLPDPAPSMFVHEVANIITASTISATFALDTTKAVVTATAGAGGTISPPGKTAVVKGQSQAYTITPALNYRILDVKLDGKSVGKVSSYTVTNVQAAHTIAATFAPLPVITAKQSAGGKITPPGATVVPYLGSLNYAVTPNTGYMVSALTINGKAAPGSTSHFFSSVTANSSIAATFKLQTSYALVTATAGAGGTITPAGGVPVFKGNSQLFSFTPAANYRILDVKVDGKSVGNASTYTITNVQAAHSIAATFVKLPVITAKQAVGGSISPAGATVVSLGGMKTYTITPDMGYDISTLVINGKTVAAAGSYAFTNVTAASSTISATFKLRTDHVLVTATAGAGGTISPAGKVAVLKGESQLFSFTPASTAYRILDVKVDGKSVGNAGTYTIANVQAAHTIAATFTAGTHPVVATSPSGGTITPSGTIQVAHGKDQSFTVTPPAGFKAGIRVDGVLKAQEATGHSLTYVLKKVNSPHQVAAVYAPVGSQFTGTLGITLVGLGDTIKVANASPAPFTILTNGTLGVASVFFGNLTARSWGHATAGLTPDQWSAKVALLPGDNDLWFVAVSLDGSASWYPARVTYYPTADFTTPLTPSVSSLVVGQSTNITWRVGLLHAAGATVTLYQVAGDGSVSNGVIMNDAGNAPDDIEGDGIFTASSSFTAAAIGYYGFRVKVQKAGLADYYSEIRQIWAPPPVTDAQVNTAGTLADTADADYAAAIAGGKTPQEAAEIVADALRQDPSIGTVGTTEEGGVWWVTTDGILGVSHQFNADEKAGMNAGGPVPERGPAPPVLTPEQAQQAQNPYYSPADLATLFPPPAAGSPEAQPESLSHILATAGPPANRMKSDRAVIISPFIANPNAPGNNFGTGDDWFKPWPTIYNHKTCGLYADKELLNNGSATITLADFKNLSRYGYIHISAHGDNYYNGLLSLWKDVWGPNDFLKGNLSIVCIYSGVRLSIVDGKYVKTGFEDDLAQKRIAIGGGGLVVLLPKFFQDYLTPLPNSLVVLSACRSGYNGSMMSVFRSKGAGAVIGYTDYVATSYTRNTLQEVVDRMYEDKTLGEALSSAVTKYGSSDADSDPAFLVYLGAEDLKFPDSKLSNGGFEDGVIDPWNRVGDGRVITALGSTRPTNGNFMGIISTGLGFTTSSGSIEQRTCVPDAGGQLVFDWNFFSEEWLEYVGSQYQDAFYVSVAVVDPTTGAVGAFNNLYSQTIDSLAGYVTKADVGFDQGGVYKTGWFTNSLDLSAYKGKTIVVRFACTDVGDSIYDSAILLDEIAVVPVAAATH